MTICKLLMYVIFLCIYEKNVKFNIFFSFYQAQRLKDSMKYIPLPTEAHRCAITKAISYVKLLYVDESVLQIYRNCGKRLCNALEALMPGY